MQVLFLVGHLGLEPRTDRLCSLRACHLRRRRFAPCIVSRCARGAICARSLECEHSDSASLDYVASGSIGRAVKDRSPDVPPKKEITKTDTPKGSILVILGGDKGSRTPDLLNAIQALSQLSYTPKRLKYVIADLFGFGGGEGSRTPVRKPLNITFYECISSFVIPLARRRRTGFTRG